MIDFSWDKKQTLLKREVIRFAQQSLISDLIELDKKERVASADWHKASLAFMVGPSRRVMADMDILSTVYGLTGLGYGRQRADFGDQRAWPLIAAIEKERRTV